MKIKRPNELSSIALLVIAILTTTTVISVQAAQEASKQNHHQLEAQVPSKDSVSLDAKKVPESTIVEVNSSPVESKTPESTDSSRRKARAEAPAETSSSSSPSSSSSSSSSSSQLAAESSKASQEQSKTVSNEKITEKAAEKQAATKQEQPAAKAKIPSSKSQTSSKSKNSNLGTVTSTGSGSYLSKHDAYSAIAEKHGAVAQNAMRKSDKRRVHHQSSGFGGIQKASGGIGEMLSPFKGVTDSGLARTLGASMRSIMKSKYSVPAYVASALLGAVALMAFYESPISPLPVPALPEPPVGRFPPEMPNIPQGTQVPFRVNQQNYNNQRSSLGAQASNIMSQYAPSAVTTGQSQQQQQVFFPSSNGLLQPAAQQRQMTEGGPMQQLAANLLSVASGKQQNAQRKSATDFEPSSRSFFNSNNLIMQGNANQKMSSAPANQQKQSTASSFLSFLGFGGLPAASSVVASNQASSSQTFASPLNDINQLNGNIPSTFEPKGSANAQAASSSQQQQQQSVLSNSHLINKVKSLFSRSVSSSSSAGQMSASNNPYDQYSKMSLVQALMKDTAFLPAFLAPTRKSSPANSIGSSQSAGSRLQATINNVLAASTVNGINQPNVAMAAARMSQADPLQQQPISSQPVNVPAASKSKQSGFGVAKAADKIAHALLETISYGFLTRNAQVPVGPSSDGASMRKADDHEQSPLASATKSLISEFVSLANQSQGSKTSEQAAPEQPVASSPAEKPTARSAESTTSSDNSNKQHDSATGVQVASASSSANPATEAASSQPQQLIRKTRSAGFEYQVEANPEQYPSKATQINNYIDLVADSYANNKLLFNLILNQVGLSQAVPYVEQILTTN